MLNVSDPVGASSGPLPRFVRHLISCRRVDHLCIELAWVTLNRMNPFLRQILKLAGMLMWMGVAFFIPFNLSPELRAQAWVAVAELLALTAVVWFCWWVDGMRTRSRAFSFATLWFIPVGSMNIARQPFWPWAESLWPWVAIIAGLSVITCICLSSQASEAEDNAAGKEPGPPVSALRTAVGITCVGLWVITLGYEGWPVSWTQSVSAKIAVNIIAVGSLYMIWRVNPSRTYQWNNSNRYFILLGLLTVSALGGGISQWAWGNQELWVCFSLFAFTGWVICEVWARLASPRPPANPVA